MAKNNVINEKKNTVGGKYKAYKMALQKIQHKTF